MAKILGRSIIGFRQGVQAVEPFFGINPAIGERLQPGFSSATAAEVDLAAQLGMVGLFNLTNAQTVVSKVQTFGPTTCSRPTQSIFSWRGLVFA
jgi:hypothetical protein